MQISSLPDQNTHIFHELIYCDSLSLPLSNVLKDMCAKCVSLDYAQLLYDMILEFENEAIATFKKMNISRKMSNVITFISIRYASSHSG